jgi:hypothetical protein
VSFLVSGFRKETRTPFVSVIYFCFLPEDRPLYDRTEGVSESTLRLPAALAENPKKVFKELKKAVTKILSLYPDGGFEVRERRKKRRDLFFIFFFCFSLSQTVVTANAITRGVKDKSWSIYFGQDTAAGGEQSVKFSDMVMINNISDISSLPLSFGVEDFSKIFFKVYKDTLVTIEGLANVIFLFRKLLNSYQRDKKTEGRTHVMLY